ncbi:MAG: hypothetical protein QXY10_01690 [Candidatus Micrarchaeaceae archaeon]
MEERRTPKEKMGIEIDPPKLLPYNPAEFCQICGHSKAQHHVTKTRILKDGTIIPGRKFCRAPHCYCPGFVPGKKKIRWKKTK